MLDSACATLRVQVRTHNSHFVCHNKMAELSRDFRRAERTNPLALGRWVTVEGLQSAQELNGLTGEIVKEEAKPGRAGVLVHVPDRKERECSIDYKNLCPFDDKQTVMAVRLGAKGEGHSLHLLETRVPRQLFSAAEELCPVPRLCGIPLVVAKVQPYVRLGERGDYDNQWATFLMIESSNGFAPPAWQSHVGPVVVYRDDNGDFNRDDMLMLNSYLSNLLDRFSDENARPADMTPRAFRNFKVQCINVGQVTPNLNI